MKIQPHRDQDHTRTDKVDLINSDIHTGGFQDREDVTEEMSSHSMTEE